MPRTVSAERRRALHSTGRDKAADNGGPPFGAVASGLRPAFARHQGWAKLKNHGALQRAFRPAMRRADHVPLVMRSASARSSADIGKAIGRRRASER